MTPTPSERTAWNPCQRRTCGHTYAQHDLGGGRCNAYHCRCAGWISITRAEYEAGKR